MNNNVNQELLILYLDYEFSQLNLYLTEEQLNSIVNQYVSSITFSFTEEQLLNTKYSKEEDMVEDVLNIIENMQQKFEEFIALSDNKKGKYSAN